MPAINGITYRKWVGFNYRHGQLIGSYITKEETSSTEIISYLYIFGDGQGLVILSCSLQCHMREC